jgi:hypothetical protein
MTYRIIRDKANPAKWPRGATLEVAAHDAIARFIAIVGKGWSMRQVSQGNRHVDIQIITPFNFDRDAAMGKLHAQLWAAGVTADLVPCAD